MSIYRDTIPKFCVHEWKLLQNVPRYLRLLTESGAINVASSRVQIATNYASNADAVDCTVVFDSRYWTGLGSRSMYFHALGG